MVTLDEVTKQFGGVRALSRVSVTFAEGKIVAVIGPNGAGKSTMFSIVAGGVAPTSGRVRFKGRDITGWTADRVCRLGICRTFQVVRPFWSLSVRAHLHAAGLFGGNGVRGSQIDDLIDLTGLRQHADLPASSLTLAGCRRLEIARAVATGASVILLDETMAGLTPEEMRAAVTLIRRVRDMGRTPILVEHVLPAVIDLCEKAIVLDYGEVIAEGTPREVLGLDVVKKAYLGE